MTGIVAFGVFLEGPEVLHETVVVFRRASKPEEHRPSWITLVALLGWIFVALGVAGEGIAEGFVSKADGIVQTFNSILLADTQKQTAFALERAANNEKEAAQLRKDAEGEKTARQALQGKITEAQNRVEDLRKANNEAAGRLEEEKRKRLQLAVSLLPRNFRDQSGALLKLGAFKTSVQVIFEFTDEREVTRTAEQIAWVCALLHWKYWRLRGPREMFIDDGITISPGSQMFDFPPTSEMNTIQERARVWESQKAVVEAVSRSFVKTLQDSGLDAKIGNEGYRWPPDTMVISVGFKPNRVLDEAIKELGEPEATPIPGFVQSMGGNRVSIPDKTSVPASKNP